MGVSLFKTLFSEQINNLFEHLPFRHYVLFLIGLLFGLPLLQAQAITDPGEPYIVESDITVEVNANG
jgi:hypothetical protein